MDEVAIDWRFTASRFTSWVLPMLVLIESFPRPHLGWKSELFTVVHLLGDPMGTIEGLLQKLRSRKLNDRYWERLPARDTRIEWKKKNWKSIALIVDAYDEFGRGEVAREKLKPLFDLSSNLSPTELEKLQRILDLTSHALDPRWPVSLIATSSFCVGAVLLEWFHQPNSSDARALGAREDMIALSLMYSWLPMAIFLSSMIRTSSTRGAVPGLLQVLHKNLAELVTASDSNSLDIALNQPNSKVLIASPNFWSSGVAILIVGAGVIPVHLLFGHSPFVAILELWAASFLFSLIFAIFIPKFGLDSLLFPLMLYKDVYMVLFTIYVFATPIYFSNPTIYSEHWISRTNRTPYLYALINFLSIAVVLGLTFADAPLHSTPFEIARDIYSNVRQSRPIEQTLESDNAHAYVSNPLQSEDPEPKFRNKFTLSYSGGEVLTTSPDLRHTEATVSNNNPELPERHVDCTLISKLVRAAEKEHGKPIVQLLRDFHTIVALKLCFPPTAWLSPESQSILQTFKSAYTKTGKVSPPSMDPSLFIKTMNSLEVSQSNNNFDTILSPQGLINRIMRPAISRGNVRLTWQCECNAEVYGDFDDSDGVEIDHLVHELVSDGYPYFDIQGVWTLLLGAYTALNEFKETDTVFLSQLNPIIEEVNTLGTLIEGIESSGPGTAGGSGLLSAPNVGSASNAPTNSKAIGSLNTASQSSPINAASISGSGTPARVTQPIKKFIALCVNTQLNFVSLGESDVSTAGSDSEVFRKFQDVYSSLRSKKYAAFKKWLIQPVDIKFIQFTVEDSHRVDICHDPPFIPPESEVQAKRYEYNPCPLRSMPPIPAPAFLHYLSCTAPLRGTKWLNRLPKKLQTKLQDVRRSTQLDEDVRGWGILIIEGPNKVAMTWLTGIVVTLSGVLSVVYAVVKNDVSGGFAIGAYVIAFWVAWMTAFYFQWKE